MRGPGAEPGVADAGAWAADVLSAGCTKSDIRGNCGLTTAEGTGKEGTVTIAAGSGGGAILAIDMTGGAALTAGAGCCICAIAKPSSSPCTLLAPCREARGGAAASDRCNARLTGVGATASGADDEASSFCRELSEDAMAAVISTIRSAFSGVTNARNRCRITVLFSSRIAVVRYCLHCSFNLPGTDDQNVSAHPDERLQRQNTEPAQIPLICQLQQRNHGFGIDVLPQLFGYVCFEGFQKKQIRCSSNSYCQDDANSG